MTEQLQKYIEKHCPEVPACFAGSPLAWRQIWLQEQYQFGKIPKKLREEVGSFAFASVIEEEHEYQEPNNIIRVMVPGSDGMGNEPVYKEYYVNEVHEMGRINNMYYSIEKQQLIDICFSCVLTVLDKEFNKDFIKMTKEQQAEWVAKQLRECGFDTEPRGCKWGVLKEN